jgi:glyoxalase superfamily protein
MHTFLDSKLMAKALRSALAERRIDISHSDSLELVARQFGFDNWNMLAARIDAAASPLMLPAGWIVDGTGAELYRLGMEPEVSGTVRIERIAGTEDGGITQTFATLMQSIDAAAYIGHSLRLSAELMTRGAGKASLWIRVDAAAGGRSLRFDNMFRRTSEGPLSGDMPWTRRSIAFEVPNGALSIHYGVMLLGPGAVRSKSLRLDEVDPSEVASTGPLPSGPVNLGFGEGEAA